MVNRLYLGKCPICKKELRISRIDGAGIQVMRKEGKYYHWKCYWNKRENK